MFQRPEKERVLGIGVCLQQLLEQRGCRFHLTQRLKPWRCRFKVIKEIVELRSP
jgi:hypothetical protein